jgi:hypothetical protein
MYRLFLLVNYVDMYVMFMVSCVLGSVFLPEEGSSVFPKHSLLCWVFYDKGKSSCKSCFNYQLNAHFLYSIIIYTHITL